MCLAAFDQSEKAPFDVSFKLVGYIQIGRIILIRKYSGLRNYEVNGPFLLLVYSVMT